MRERVVRLLAVVFFIFALAIPTGLRAANWEKLDISGLPKDDEGKPSGVNAIGLAGKNNAFISLDQNLFHWNGKSFKEMKHNYTGKKGWVIRDFFVNSEKDIWAAGDNGMTLHYDGKKWQEAKNPLTGTGRRPGRLYSIACATAKQCFAGSRSGDLIVWDGSSWKFASKAGDPPAEGARIYTIRFASKDVGWLAGGSLFAKWDGSSWKKVDVEAPRIYALTLVSKKYGWAVGDGGAFFQFDGETWKKANVKGSFFRMRSGSCASQNDCWAVGDAGAAFHWDGKGWTKVKIGIFDRLNTVALGHGQGLLGSDKGDIFKLK